MACRTEGHPVRRAIVAIFGAVVVMLSDVLVNRWAAGAAAVAITGTLWLTHRHEWASVDGWVYLLRCDAADAWKIGWSGAPRSPHARVDDIISEADLPVRLICYGPGGRLLESSLHAKYAAQHVATRLPAPTEWFSLDKGQAADVAALLTGRR